MINKNLKRKIRTMKCILSGGNTRVLSEVINSFSQIGSDLYLKANEYGMTLRTVNYGQTAFAEIHFELDFFIDFKFDRSNPDHYSIKCKISLKSFVDVFENVSQVEECSIVLNLRSSKILIRQIFKAFDITHHVYVDGHETLRSVLVSADPNRITAPNKLFADIISNFRMYDKEITIKAATDSLIWKNYIDETESNEHLTETELTLRPEEFLEYRIEEPTEITFCIKGLRKIINFCVALSLDMTITFESAGGAVVFACVHQNRFTARFVLSSLESDEMPDSCSTDDIYFPETPPESDSSSSRISQKVKPMHINGSDINDFTEIIETKREAVVCQCNDFTHKSNNTRKRSRSPLNLREKKRRLKRMFERCYKNDSLYGEDLPGAILAENTDDEA